MDLYCMETVSSNECKAYADPAFILDERVMQNLLKGEERYNRCTSYFGTVQMDISPAMRRIVADWMFEVRFKK